MNFTIEIAACAAREKPKRAFGLADPAYAGSQNTIRTTIQVEAENATENPPGRFFAGRALPNDVYNLEVENSKIHYTPWYNVVK